MVVVCDLHHASPRIPGLMNEMANLGWQISIITPRLKEGFERNLGFPSLFREKVRIVQVRRFPSATDVVRSFLLKVGFEESKSLLEQIKDRTKNERSKSRITKAFYKFQEILEFPDSEVVNIPMLLFGFIKEVGFRRQQLFVFTSSPYNSIHVIGKFIKFKRAFWIADFRDTWTSNPVYPYGMLRKLLEQRFEKFCLTTAKLITTVSGEYADSLKTIHSQKIIVVENGFIERERDSITVSDYPDFKIVYTGVVYEDAQDPDIFLRGFKTFVETQKLTRRNLQCLFAGRYNSRIRNYINQYSLEGNVKQLGQISREESWKMQDSSDCLLYFSWNFKIGGLSHLKFYEYVSSRKIIMSVGRSTDRFADIIEENNLGKHLFNQDEVFNYLQKLYETKAIKGTIDTTRKPNFISQFSFRQRAGLLNSTLSEILSYKSDS